MNDATPGAGHNRPPEPSPIDRVAGLVANANRWIAERPTIEDREIAGIAQGFVKQLRESKADLEAAEKAERKPLDLAAAAIRVRYRTPLELVGIALAKMLEKLGPWLDRERNRLAAEDAERQRQAVEAERAAERARQEAAAVPTVEAELAARDAAKAAEAAAKAARKGPERARVKGDLATKAMSLVARWSAEVTDEDAALEFYGNDVSVRLVALQQATRLASALARETKDAKRAPPGFRFVVRETPT